MALEAAALLNQLMGDSRNEPPGSKKNQLDWRDKDVCKHYLCGFCPSDLFTNTKADIGTCHKIHDERLRKAYEESAHKGMIGYEEDFLDYLERLIRDLDRKVNRGKDRLRRSAEAKQQALSGDGITPSDKLKQLNTDINTKMRELEHLGAMGQVEEARELMKQLEVMERERERERMALTQGGPKTLAGFELDAHDFHEKMELCEVCGSFLVIGDTQCRVDAHLLGKMHMGYARIRSTITQLRTAREERLKKRSEELSKHRERDRSREREKRRSSHRSRSPPRRRGSRRSRSRERGRRNSKERRKSRSRSRERRIRRSRSRSRDRRRSRRSRSRSRERHRRRSRSRERNRSRSRERRRSRSKERKRSRSRDRKRSRSRERKRSRSRERKTSTSQEQEKKKEEPVKEKMEEDVKKEVDNGVVAMADSTVQEGEQ